MEEESSSSTSAPSGLDSPLEVGAANVAYHAWESARVLLVWIGV